MQRFRLLLFIYALFSCFCGLMAAAQCPPDEIINLRKTAIVFGEKDYQHCPKLANPENDAEDIRDSLKRLGFAVLTYIDADRPSMENAITHWCSELDNYDVALFYFSGHGAEVKGDNFLFPIDIDARGPSDLSEMAFPVNKLLDAFDNSHLKYSVLILDACRNNPFSKGWNRGIGEGGLAQMAGKGTFIAFAATPGQTASDGMNRNGIYTEAILKNIMTPDRSVSDIFTNVNGYVRTVTKGEQEPFFNSSMGRLYCFSVTRPRKPLKKARLPQSYQLSSAIAISADEGTVFTVNQKKHEVSLHDTKTMNLLRTLISIPGQPGAIISAGFTDLILLDSAGRSVTEVDWQQDKLVSQLPLTITPVSAVLSPDQKRLYVFGNDKGQSTVVTIDLLHNKTIMTKPLGAALTKIVCDEHTFYALLADDDKAVTLMDIRSGAIKKISIGGAVSSLAVSPDDKQLYLVSRSHDKIWRYSLSDHKLADTLTIKARNVYFSEDNHYALAENTDLVTLFRTIDGTALKKINFYYPPDGLITDNSNIVYVWLPDENRVFSFHLEEQLKDSVSGLDPEAKLKAFQAWIKSDPTLKSREEQRKNCDQLHHRAGAFYQHLVYQTVAKLPGELSIDYGMRDGSYVTPDCDCAKGTATFTAGIHGRDQSKYISPLFSLQFSDTEVTLTLQDKNYDQKPVKITKRLVTLPQNAFPLSLPLSSDDSKTVDEFVRNYFIDHLDYLK